MPLYEDEFATADFAPIGSAVARVIMRAGWSAGVTECHDWVAEEEFERASDQCPERLKEQAKAAFDKALLLCESPIEKALAPWLICQWYEWFDYSPTVLRHDEKALYVPKTLAVIPQLPIGRYRADFALAGSRGGLVRFVIVECDGKEFHNGVADVKRDIDRDVAILSNKRVLDVVRLDGRDIMSNPGRCARRAADAVKEAWRKGNPATAAKFES